MEGLKNYREKLKNIEKLVSKMESGQLSIHELSELETLTRELHERSIILKYKAFEKAGEQRQDSASESKMNVTVPTIQKEMVVEDTVLAPIAEVEEKIKEKVETEAAPVLEFSIFDEVEDEEQEVAVVAEAPKMEETVEEEKVVEEKKPVHEVIPEPESKVELTVEEPIVIVREKGSSFLDRLSILDNSISSQLAGRKIDTLSGAFGINERLLYINELFDGSGEAFSDAIKALDSQSNLDAASSKVEELAFKNSWNPEEEVVLEFLAIIKRRYA